MATSFKKSLFWDVAEVDDQKNGKFVIERVLNFGDENDFQKAMDRYGNQEIEKVVLGSRNLNKKSLFFWCQYFHIDQNKCLSNLSAIKQSLFSRR
jgi:hypothetical protein